MECPIICEKCKDIMVQEVKRAVAETKQAIMQNETIIAMAFKLMERSNYTFDDACQAIREEMNK